MADNKNLKTKIWVYAVVLFTSAFIVLLITAYVQIKQQKNIDDYKVQISQQQSENKNIQISYSNAQKMISELTVKNEELSAENNNLKDTLQKLEEQLEEIKNRTQETQKQYESFCEAQSEYIKGNIVASALLLKKIDNGSFTGKTLEEYHTLLEKATVEAGKQLYDEGYKLYQKTKYSEAIAKFALSRDIDRNESFSDNCLYYLAYAQYRIGNKTNALELMKTLTEEYPESSFINNARNFIKKHSNN